MNMTLSSSACQSSRQTRVGKPTPQRGARVRGQLANMHRPFVRQLCALGLAASAHASYPGNFALKFNPEHEDIVRVPHESSMQGPLIDSFTVEMWLLAEPRAQLAPEEGRVVNLVGFPGRHPFVGLASDTGCAVVQLKLANGSWYSCA